LELIIILQIVRRRDLAFLVIFAIAIYISLDNTTFNYRLEPAWYYDQRKSSSGDWQVLPPIITDLNGDGRKEVLFITRDQYLKVLSAESPSILSEDIYSPEEISSIRLSPLLNVNKVLRFIQFKIISRMYELIYTYLPGVLNVLLMFLRGEIQ